jgi:hypothetical protein
MILIAHRGNTNGPNPKQENNPKYIDYAIKKGYDVEIDVRGSSLSEIYLGHDYEQYKVSFNWLIKRIKNLWIHAKDIEALYQFTEPGIEWNCFWHEEDRHTLTTHGYIWAYPGSALTHRSICVMPEAAPTQYTQSEIQLCAGICSDFIEKYR